MKIKIASLSGLLGLGLLFAPATRAQTPASPEVEAIRKEMQQMRADYERRMDLLEQRLQQVEPGAASTNLPAPAVVAAGTNSAPTA